MYWPGWETVGLIGRGSFGAVYEIQRDVLGDVEKAALKVISIPQNDSDIEELYSDGYDDESITNTFKSHLKSIVAEYSLMRKMNGCSNVVNCDDIRYIQHDDGIGWDIFIKMELLTPLTKAIKAEYSEETVVKIAKDMCVALQLCKNHEIVHRDIKPQNIFVSPNGDYKLGDFGIAKTVEKTMGGTKIGTYKYMAPEVYHYQPYGHTADIYSLGLVLYWLMNERRMPFMPLPPEKLKAGVEEHARNRRLSGESLPEPACGSKGLKQVVLRACSYDPKKRYQSANEMLQDIEMIHKNGVISTMPSVSATHSVISGSSVIPTAQKRDDHKMSSQENEAEASCEMVSNIVEKAIPASTIAIAVDRPNGWRCTCGREHPNYVSSCVCGTSKIEVMNKKGTCAEEVCDNGHQRKISAEEKNKPVEVLENALGNVVCPICNYTQRADRNICWNCGQKFVTKHAKTDSIDLEQQKDAEFVKLKQAHEYWSKLQISNMEAAAMAQPKQPVDDWRKAEAAHRAWLQSLEK